jgi:hypothetical protein
MNSELNGIQPRHCPICRSENHHTALNLPSTPLGDRFTTDPNIAKSLTSYPLKVDRCVTCGHCFVPYLTEPDESYQHYLFESDQSPGLHRCFTEIASDLGKRHSLTDHDLVLDIGANDGTWLSCFEAIGCDLIAVEPAPRPAEAATGRGITVINDYFTEEKIRSSGLIKKTPKLISMNYAFANISDPIQVLRDIASIADSDTIISVLTGYHPAQLAVGMFDYVYHEHLSYYSCQDFLTMTQSAGLIVSYCCEVPLKGGSLHLEMRKADSGIEQSTLFAMMLKREAWLDQPRNIQWGLMNEKLQQTRSLIQSAIQRVKAQHRPIVGYGASHSTTTLVYSLGIETSLDFVVDDNRAKQGRYSPGTGIPVDSPECLSRYPEACVVILGWQHGQQIIDALRRRGFRGLVITPFPSFREERLSR